MTRLRISATLAGKYEARGMDGLQAFEKGPNPYAKIGRVVASKTIDFDPAEVAELLADARFQSGAFGPLTDPEYIGLRSAYRALARQIEKALKDAGDRPIGRA